MSSLNAKCRANFAEWLENIADHDFQTIVFANTGTAKAEFGSEDFCLYYTGVRWNSIHPTHRKATCKSRAKNNTYQ